MHPPTPQDSAETSSDVSVGKSDSADAAPAAAAGARAPRGDAELGGDDAPGGGATPYTLYAKDPLLPTGGDGEEPAGVGGVAGPGRTAVSLTKCFVGAASFELPWAFMQAGWGGALLGIIFLAFLSGFSLTRLARCGTLAAEPGRPPPTYPAIGFAAAGCSGYMISWFGVSAMTLGVCGSYLVFITSTLPDIVGWGTQAGWLLIFLPIVWALSCVTRIDWLAWTNAFGVAALVFAIAATVVDCLDGGGRWKRLPEWEQGLPFVRWDTYPLFLGNAAYLYLISTCVVPLAQAMRRPSRFHVPYAASAVAVTVVNISFALLAWASYGDCPDGDDSAPAVAGSLPGSATCTKGNVVDNLPDGGTKKAVQSLLCIDLLFTCVIFVFPFTQAVERELLGPARLAAGSWATVAQRGAVRLACVCAIAAIAYFVPSFELLTGLTGGFGNNILGIILPPVFYHRLQPAGHWTRRGWRLAEEAALVATCIVGIAFLGLSTSAFIRKIADES